MLAFDRKLVVLPFRQHASLMEIENGGQEVLARSTFLYGRVCAVLRVRVR
jgi:hypothetical protein